MSAGNPGRRSLGGAVRRASEERGRERAADEHRSWSAAECGQCLEPRMMIWLTLPAATRRPIRSSAIHGGSQADIVTVGWWMPGAARGDARAVTDRSVSTIAFGWRAHMDVIARYRLESEWRSRTQRRFEVSRLPVHRSRPAQ